jgi:uncharacterized protein
MVSTVMWKLSQFNVVHNLADRGLASHNFVFNTLTRKCFVVKVADWGRVISSLNTDGVVPEIERARNQLSTGGLTVEPSLEQRGAWQAEFDSVRYSRRSIYPIVAITTACNIGCTYCYEEGVAYETMTPEVVLYVLRWMERRIVLDGIREIHPALFGGEPLLFPNLLFQLMDGVAQLTRRFGVMATFSCSSNGVMMTDELASELEAKGLKQIQISLDGPEHIHDQRRIGKRGQGTFRQSVRGIKTALRHIGGVTVKLNFDRHNLPYLDQLLDFLVGEGLAGCVTVKLETIASQMSSSRVVRDPTLVIPPDSEELADAYVWLYLECKRRGLSVTDDTGHTSPCMFTSDHGVIIGPDGDIYKCISLVGRHEFRVGSVFEEEYDLEEYRRQMDCGKRLDECFRESCAYMPVCAGGCAYESIVRTGLYLRRHCTKTFLARFYYLNYLLKHEKRLVALGMRPLGTQELTASVVTAPLNTADSRLVQIQTQARALSR